MLRRSILLMALLLPCISGCVLLAVGAGGGAGYYIAKEDDRDEPQVAADKALVYHVKDRFAQDPDVAALHLSVDSYDNVVTLQGSAPNEALAERAIGEARDVATVKGVRSEITITVH